LLTSKHIDQNTPKTALLSNTPADLTAREPAKHSFQHQPSTARRESSFARKSHRILHTDNRNEVTAAQLPQYKAHLRRHPPEENVMSKVAGAEAQANKDAGKQAGRNRPSDLNELRDNVANVASSVGDMANHQYEQAYEVAIDAVEETGQIISRNPLASVGVGLGVGFLLGRILAGGSRA
jgi:ElaB/YqjD/DUF883 family membrane-anchored ribosome-binding protein